MTTSALKLPGPPRLKYRLAGMALELGSIAANLADILLVEVLNSIMSLPLFMPRRIGASADLFCLSRRQLFG
ncbi:hypothetical protein DFAR_630038 [Desulfarculales bacterium]